MNIIPSTFNEHQINCIILGGKYNDSPDALNISVVLLNSKGSHLKIHVFENLLKNNFHSIISIENDVENTSLEEISKKFPTIKFIVPLEENKVSDGELINLAMNEVKTDFVLILRDTINIPAGFLSNNLAILSFVLPNNLFIPLASFCGSLISCISNLSIILVNCDNI